MKQFRVAMIGGCFALLLGLVACNIMPSMSNAGELSALLSGRQEVPPVKGSGAGTLDAQYNKRTGELSWTINYGELSGPVTAAHFHGPANPGQNAGVAVPMLGVLASPIKGLAKLTPAQADELLAGKWYVNLHTATNPNGEIRGQVSVKA